MAAGSLQPSMAPYFPGYRPFDPESLGLGAGFRLTSFSDMKGLLTGLEEGEPEDVGVPRLGIGMDSCVIPLRHRGLSLVQTTDFFYPSVEDPYMQGRIACANVLSDLYAMGITECDNMLMLLSVSQKMTEEEREKVTPLMIKGFKDAAEEGGTSVTGGQTVVNPWIIIAAALMHTFNAHAATDITGFGILGHAQNLAQQQQSEVSFVIHNLPIIAKMTAITKACGNRFSLLQGTSAETSGGLLICLPREQAARFCAEIKSPKYGEGHQAWIIGIVEKGNRSARIIEKPRIIEVIPRGAGSSDSSTTQSLDGQC
ncbi:hypothetical protein AB205_0096560 [Aquarana catesbeiana]|uniref:selenide, water dikinase n=1 Tax=Aquarana catesbeiana TaxID=8400 RepID=A0A2G9SAB2_AQUCT|nr:hypothetical protein AB205_0096560 [Aquarana catesbeiana]